MRILVATTSFPRWPGDGRGVFVWEAARAVARRGIEVRVLATHSPGDATHEVMDGVEVFRPRYLVPERWEMLRKEAAGLPVIWHKYPWARFQIVPFTLVSILATARLARWADLVHAHWTIPAANALLGKPVHGRPVMVTLQGSDILHVAAHPAGRWLTRAVLAGCARVAPISTALAEAAAALGVPRGRMRVVPNGVDSRQFVPIDDAGREDTILFVGSLIPRKGVHFLLEAAPSVLRAYPSYRLVIVGEGSAYAALKEQAEALGFGERVVFTGALLQEQVRAWMQRARLLVLPSVQEGQGVVLLEALACGTPVVASAVGGIVDVVAPEVGRLVPPADAGALADAICEVLAIPGDWAAMSRAARQRAVTEYDWERIAGLYVDLYGSVRAAAGRGGPDAAGARMAGELRE